MANMSEEWRQSIVEVKLLDPRGRKRATQRAAERNGCQRCWKDCFWPNECGYANSKRKTQIREHLDVDKAYDEKQRKKSRVKEKQN
jgi:hypothetical protein